MQQKFRTTTILCSLMMVATVAAAQRQWTVTGKNVPELAAVDRMMREMMQQNGIRGGSVAIAKNGRLVYARGFTWDQPGVEPIEPTTLFRTASIAKSISSIAIHQMIEDGLLSYRTPVASTLDLKPAGPWASDPRLSRVTLDHLLTHTVGLDRDQGFGIDPMVYQDELIADWLGVDTPPTRHEIATFTSGMRFQFEPGTRWAYCNVGYLLLQMLAEKATGRDFPEYVLDNVFRRVGVSRARMAHTPRSDLAPTETTYDGVYGDAYSLTAENHFAGGGMLLTAPDLARVYSVLFDHQDAGGLLEPESVASMLELPFRSSRETGYARGWFNEKMILDSGYSLGWLTDPNDGREVWGHSGGGLGVHTVAVRRSDGVVFVWFTNRGPTVETVDFPRITSWPTHDLWQSVGISSDPMGSAPAESWIPAVAHAKGVGDSTWRSDVGLLNRSSGTNVVRLRYHQENGAIDREIELSPGESRTVSDVVGWFNREGSAPLQVFSADAVTVTSRTYNQSYDGTFGQSFDGVTATGGLESGESVALMQLREDDVARTNIGILNQWRRAARVEIELYDGDGSLVTAHSREIPAQQTVQLNRPFHKLGRRADIESGYAVITVLSGQDIYVYASVIDNATGDPTAIPMKTGFGSRRQWIAAAAHSSGVHDSVWRTDICLLNRSGDRAAAEITLHRDNGDSASLSLDVYDGEQIVVDDIVAQLGLTGSGSIEVHSDYPLLASSRTYNAGEDGTFGLFLDGLSTGAMAEDGDTVWLPQLRQNQAFRTNVGLVNTGGSQARIRISFLDGSGSKLAARWKTLEAKERIQLQEPFARIAGRTDIAAGSAKIKVESGQGVIAYASVIDNLTNDGTAIAMKR